MSVKACLVFHTMLKCTFFTNTLYAYSSLMTFKLFFCFNYIVMSPVVKLTALSPKLIHIHPLKSYFSGTVVFLSKRSPSTAETS